MHKELAEMPLAQMFETCREHEVGVNDNGRCYVAFRHVWKDVDQTWYDVWVHVTLMDDGTYVVSE